MGEEQKITDVDAFVDDWVYNIGRVLTRRVESLKDDLRSDTKRTMRRASNEIQGIFAWLEPPLPVLTDAARLRRIEELAVCGELSEVELRKAILDIVRAPRRARGRPRTDTAQHAIRAYSMHLKTRLTWREIAKAVMRCEHRYSDAKRSCPECADALRDAVGRLEKFLQRNGLHPGIPRRMDRVPLSRRKR